LDKQERSKDDERQRERRRKRELLPEALGLKELK
jgi:hypothetical protein